MSDGMVIAGAGEAGARATSCPRERAFTGPVTLVGARRMALDERPPLSKAVMTADEGIAPTTILDEAKLAAQSLVHLAGGWAGDRLGRPQRDLCASHNLKIEVVGGLRDRYPCQLGGLACH